MLTIRWRLALTYGCAMAVFLIVFGALVYALIGQSLLSRIDFELEEELTELRIELQQAFVGEPRLELLREHFAEHALYEFEISDMAGESLFRSTRLADRRLRNGIKADALRQRVIAQQDLAGLGEYRVLTERMEAASHSLLVQVAIPLRSVRDVQRHLLQTFGVAGPVVLLLAMAGGYVMARRALAPIRQMTRSAALISSRDLHQRLDVSPVDDELSELGRTLNAMIERLEKSFENMRRFTADAAHELRTPLTVIRTQLDVALRGERSVEELRQVLTSVQADSEQLSRLVSNLLQLARADQQGLAANSVPTDLNALLNDCWTPFELRATHKALTIERRVEVTSLIQIDRSLLSVILSNLFDNAVEYANYGGWLRLVATVVTEPQVVLEITISNSGCVLDSRFESQVFERFWRGDAARTDTSTHSGLGLSLCQCLAEALHGQLNAAIAEGVFTASLRLPIDANPTVPVAR